MFGALYPDGIESWFPSVAYSGFEQLALPSTHRLSTHDPRQLRLEGLVRYSFLVLYVCSALLIIWVMADDVACEDGKGSLGHIQKMVH